MKASQQVKLNTIPRVTLRLPTPSIPARLWFTITKTTYLSSLSRFTEKDKKHKDVQTMINPASQSKMSKLFTVTAALILASGVVALMSEMGESIPALASLFIASPGSTGLSSVLNGEVWRLITPIFIHFGAMHLIFNMMWLWDLGNLIEKKKGHLFIVKFVLAVGISSNLAEYVFTKNLFFGGMSGVVYGLLGYVWMQGKQQPSAGLVLNKQTAIMMFGWFILCWTGFLGPIANWAHTFGLGAGLLIGFLDGKKSGA